jgi:hypothetical protein
MILVGVPMNIDGVHSEADFEVNEIMDNSKTYLVFLGLDWSFDNQAIINLKKIEMIFEGGGSKGHCTIRPYQGKKILWAHDKGNR